MKIGFTGTQAGMTVKQRAEFAFWMRLIVDGCSFALDKMEFHHGGCVGADAQAHALVGKIDAGIWRHVHWAAGPGMDEKRAEDLDGLNDCQTYDGLPPLERNRVIVDTCDVLIAAPRQRRESPRGGTWATWRHARNTGRTIITIWP